MKVDPKARLENLIIQMIDTPRTYYFGAIASALPLKSSATVDSFAVSPDGELLYNPDYVNGVSASTPHRLFRDICHEVGHIALEHFARRDLANIEPKHYSAFNVAADCAIEALLDKDFPDAAGDPEHHESLEQYIPRSEWDKGSTEELLGYVLSSHPDGIDPQAGQGGKKGGSGLPDLNSQGKQRVFDAMNDAQQNAKEKVKDSVLKDAATNTRDDPKKGQKSQGNSGACNALLDPHLHPANFTSLDALKRLFKQSYGRGDSLDDSTFNQRHILRREFLGMPLIGRHQRLAVEKEGDIEEWHNDLDYYVDVSGSMPQHAIMQSLRVIHMLCQKYNVSPVRVYTYNTSIQQEFIIESHTNLDTLKIQTGGGTRINGAIHQRPPKGKLALVLTDMEDNPIPKQSWPNPDCKLVWLIHQNRDLRHENFTFGEKIYINDIVK